jgi:hypothetical protein
MPTAIVPISPIPPIAYFILGLKNGGLVVDGGEHYIKQSVRNRYHILTANGVLPLTMNVKSQNGAHVSTKDILLDYDKPWVRSHLRAVEAAYKSAPFFEHYIHHIESILSTRYSTLGSFHQNAFAKWMEILGADFKYEWQDTYFEQAIQNDYRSKRKSPNDFGPELHPKKYIQVFSDRHPFASNLSILDLIFNLGPEAISHLRT